MLTTAAGTIRPARVLVIGAGVAGLQAIATCKRLGAMVEAYDVRSAAREQIESLGAKFVDTGVSADGAGGYARDLTAEEKAQQTEKLAKAVALSDVVITTAAIPGKKAPIIITTDMISRMKYGAIIVDMAAESGGNCALTQPGEHVIANDVNIHGPLNLPSRMPTHASELYAKNLYNFISPWIKDGELVFDWSDEVVAGTLLCKDGATVNGVKQILEKPDGRPARALYLHARRLHRLRDHRQGAGHPAHAADVRLQLHSRRRGRRRHDHARLGRYTIATGHRLLRGRPRRGQCRWRLCRHRTHARHVQEEGRRNDATSLRSRRLVPGALLFISA
jgi:hypothetical protein